MKKQRRRVLEDSGSPGSVDGGEFTGASALFDQAFENLANLFTPLRGNIGPHLDNATVGLKERTVFEELLFAPAMKLEHDGLDSSTSRDGPQGDILNETLQFREPLVDDGIENLGFIPEEAIDVGMRHTERARYINDGHFIMTITTQQSFRRFENFAASIYWITCAHVVYLPQALPFDKGLNYRLHFLKLVRG